MPVTPGNWCRAVLLPVLALLPATVAAGDYEPWVGPTPGRILLTPAAGYGQGDGLDGVNLSMEVSFAFEHLLVGVQGRAVFLDSGVLYQASLDVLGYWGPVFGGLAAAGYFIPGSVGDPRPGLDFLVGFMLPLGLEGILVRVYYRPGLVFLHSRTLVNHAVLLGLTFETGS